MAEKRVDPAEALGDDEAWARRAAFYGVDLKDVPREPILAGEGECIRLVPGQAGGRFDKLVHRVPVQKLADLKRLIGMPDETARSHHCCPELPAESVPASFKSLDELDSEQHQSLYAASKAYLHGDSARVAHHLPALERAFELDRRHFVQLLVVQDLIVERNATVTLGGAMNVALFRHIVIRQNGRLRIDKSLKIDCVSIQGEGLFGPRVFDRPFLTATVAQRRLA